MILVTDLNQGKKSKDRIKYRSFKDIMLSVIDNFNDYITNIDIEKLDITKDYKKIKQTNYLDYITKTDEKLDIKEILIENEELDEKSFSKKMTKLITKEENDSIKFGLDMHYALEVTDFINPNFDNMDNFIKNKIIKFLDNDLLKNIELVDTPGYGSTNSLDTYKSHQFVQKANVVIFLTRATSPLQAMEEKKFLEEYISLYKDNENIVNANNLFIVANQIDTTQKSVDEVKNMIIKAVDDEFEGDFVVDKNNIFTQLSHIKPNSF